MFECLILGDSTGVGAAQAINVRYERQCDVQAAERATAAQILSWQKPAKVYGTAVFAIGSNDAPGPKLVEQLIKIRASIATCRVIWLLPYSRARAYTVSSVAAIYGDETVDLSRFQSRDRIHPLRYGDVARALLK